MSKTDKDRPDWVIRHSEGFPIEHDHRNGVCVIETFDYSKGVAAGNHKGHSHKNCPKYTEEHYTCTKQDPVRHKYWGGFFRTNEARDQWLSKSCWESWISYVTSSWMTTECLGHMRWIYDADTYCAYCDNEPKRPTCTPSWYGSAVGYRYWTAYGTRNKPTTEWCKLEFHGPERRRKRDTLREDLKAYNAGEELDDWDFENRQGRRSVQWNLY